MTGTTERFGGRLSGKLIGLTLGASLALGVASGIAAQPAIALRAGYMVEIPATLSVSNRGWNPTDGITASGSLGEYKKLVITANSGDEFALVSDTDSIGYRLATQDGGEETTSWEFESLGETSTTKPMGIIVDDFGNKPAGDYTDTVIFVMGVESTLNVLNVGDGKGGSVQFYYADDDTFGDAITNHPEENSNWRTENNTVYYGSNAVLRNADSNNVNPNETISATTSYTLMTLK